MREIKFRAWDKKFKGMHWDVESYDYFQPVFADGEEFVFADFISNKDNRFILMQFTGLRDSKNRDIFEGDIVTVNKRDPLHEVCFDAYNAGFSLRRQPYTNSPDLQAREDGYIYAYYYFHDSDKELEVIGNVYENPELLKE